VRLLVRIGFVDSRASARASAMADADHEAVSPSVGIVFVIAALASWSQAAEHELPLRLGLRLLLCWCFGPPDALVLSYFCEMVARVPSAFKSSSALFRSGSSPLFLRAAKPARWVHHQPSTAILTVLVAGLGEIGVHRDAVVDHHVHPALVEQLDRHG